MLHADVMAEATDADLVLPEEYAAVQDYLHDQDPDLRIRPSVERPNLFVLERRCRRAPAVNTGMAIRSDMHVQARDGYIHVSTVHREWLEHPWNIMIALRTEGVDLWAAGGVDKVENELDYEAEWAKETRKRRRREDGVAYYREVYDILSRMGNRDGTEITRFRNPGIPAAVPPIATTGLAGGVLP